MRPFTPSEFLPSHHLMVAGLDRKECDRAFAGDQCTRKKPLNNLNNWCLPAGFGWWWVGGDGDGGGVSGVVVICQCSVISPSKETKYVSHCIQTWHLLQWVKSFNCKITATHVAGVLGPVSMCPIRRLIVRFREVSKSRDLYLKLFDHSELWQAPPLRQHCCRRACQISNRCDDFNYQSRGFETSRDLMLRRLIVNWNVALVHKKQILCKYKRACRVDFFSSNIGLDFQSFAPNKPLSEPMMVKCTDAYMRHPAPVN